MFVTHNRHISDQHINLDIAMHLSVTWHFPRNHHEVTRCIFTDIGMCKFHRKSNANAIKIVTLGQTSYVGMAMLYNAQFVTDPMIWHNGFIICVTPWSKKFIEVVTHERSKSYWEMNRRESKVRCLYNKIKKYLYYIGHMK